MAEKKIQESQVKICFKWFVISDFHIKHGLGYEAGNDGGIDFIGGKRFRCYNRYPKAV
jgi:hypothetical protein